MEWSEAHYILLCREMLAVKPFQAKREATQRTKICETIVHHLEGIDQPFLRVSVRSIRDRYTPLARKFRKRTQDEIKGSGTSPEMSELEVLLEELVGPEDMSEKEQQMESEEKNTREDQDRAIDMKKKAMEKLSDTENRKSQEQDEVAGKSPGDLPVRDEYRKERNDGKFSAR